MYGQWALDERGIDPQGDPFEIEMMGLGLFACRRDAFPGFNPRMVGFGGEEGYLHEKIRRAGGRNLCLPWLRWWHRFNEFVPGAAPYIATVEDKAWNYCVGWGELGWDLAPVREHFASLMPLERFDAIAEAATRGDELPAHRTSPSPASHAASLPNDCGCHGNGKASPPEVITDSAVHAEHLRPFIERIGPVGVVYEHSASGSPATATLAALHPGIVLSFSPRHDKCAFDAFARYGKERVTLISSALKPPVHEADLIILTGYGNDPEIAPHLLAASEKSRRFVVLAGTGRSTTADPPSMMNALGKFLREHPEWSIVSHNQDADGLTVLGRDERDKPKLPSKIAMAKNFTQAVAKHVADGATKVDWETFERRLAICSVCEHRNDDRCTVCGCFLGEKAAWRTSECPLGKWER